MELLSATCAAGFVVVLAHVHAVRRDLSPVQHSLSAYLTDQTRKPLAIGYALLEIALISLGVATAIAAPRNALTLIGAALCIVAGIMLALVALTSRRSATGAEQRSQLLVRTHRFSAWAAFLLAIASMSCAAWQSWTQGGQSRLMLGILTACAIALFAAVVRGPGPRYGLWQKLLVMDVVAWLCFEAVTSLAGA